MSLIENPTVIALVAVAYTLYFSAIYFFIKLRIKKRVEKKEKFSKALVGGLKTGSITSIDDVVNIYKGVAGLGSEDLDYRYGLSKQLREFLVEIISKRIDDSLGDEVIREWKQKMSEFIKKNEEISPYADLPAAERNILNDISTFLGMNDSDSVKRKTLELAGMIQARNDDLNRIRNINKWAVPLSIIGMILTIVSTLVAIFK